MSLETWKAEFYPVSAGSKSWGKLKALEHSLKKWRGLRKKNLDKHGVTKELDSSDLNYSENGVDWTFFVDARSCALCKLYLPKEGQEGTCSKCPLFEARGRRCDRADVPLGVSPYRDFKEYSNPEPMIKLIEKALRTLRAKERHKKFCKKCNRDLKTIYDGCMNSSCPQKKEPCL